MMRGSGGKIMRKWIALSLVVMTACIFPGCQDISASGSRERSAFESFVGVSETRISEVQLSYKGVRVSLSEEATSSFLHMLCGAQRQEREGESAFGAPDHIFNASKFEVFFLAGNQETELVFYWFIPGETERQRFDLAVGEEMATFRLAESVFWGERQMEELYDSAAKEKGLLRRYEVDGMKWPPPTDSQGWADLYSHMTAEEALTGEEVTDVVFATYESSQALTPLEAVYGGPYGVFRVEEVLSGDLVPEGRIRVAGLTDIYYLYENRWGVTYSIETSPVFIEGNTYLLCLSRGEEDIFHMPYRSYGVAVLDGAFLYPPINTEHHPFYQILAGDLR